MKNLHAICQKTHLSTAASLLVGTVVNRKATGIGLSNGSKVMLPAWRQTKDSHHMALVAGRNLFSRDAGRDRRQACHQH